MATVLIVTGPRLAADPLLREDWTQTERDRVRGMVSRVTNWIESDSGRYQIPDGAGRNFYIDRRDPGALYFEPLYDGVAGNWRPVVPDVRNVALYLTEARALYQRGLKDEALYLAKAVRGMILFADDSNAALDSNLRAAVVREAGAATAWLDYLRERDRDYPRLDDMTDPYALYNGAAGWTMVIADHPGWRLRLPGNWRFLRGRDQRGATVVYLAHNEWRVMIGTDVWTSPRLSSNLPAFIREWDQRRTLTPQRKRSLAFRREELAEDLDLCPPSVVKNPERDAVKICAGFRTGLNERGKSFFFREYYRLTPANNRGLYLEFAYNLSPDAAASAVQEQSVTNVVRQIVGSLKFTEFR